ncbi:MAG: SCO family protein [Gemmatimonadetes bacterium]|nr:SCO family protein [Gemmatimonadota bacterium]
MPPQKLPIALAAACLMAACSPPAPRHGVAVEPALARPDFTLTDTRGAPYAFARETQGLLTFLFFGYTHCPDICPVHVANVAAVLRKLPFEDQRKTRFVFVTLDPARDSLPHLRRWLDQFDASFVGLRGDADDVNRIMAGIGMPPAILGTPNADGSYEVAHSAAVLVFTPDDSARVLYPFGTRQLDWADDIPRLLQVRPSGAR